MLFRTEVLNHQNQGQSHGSILLRSPKIFWFFSIVAAILSIAIIALLFTASYTQKARVNGRLLPDKGLATVNTNQSGVLLELLAKEGALIKKGQPLFRLSGERSSQLGELGLATLKSLNLKHRSLKSEIESLTALANSQRALIKQKLENAEAELPRSQVELSLQKRRLTSAREALARYEALLKVGFAGALQIQQKTDEVLDQELRLAQLERSERELRNQVAALKLDLASQSLRDQAPSANALRQLASLEQELLETEGRREWLVLSPTDGVLTSIQVNAGQTVSSSQNLAIVIPMGASLRAELLVPSSSVAFVQVGQKVNLRYAAFPYQKFGQYPGVVSEVSKTTVSAIGINSVENRQFRVIVRPQSQHVQAYGEQHQLQPDMEVEADVFLSKRSLIEWIFEPFLALKGRL